MCHFLCRLNAHSNVLLPLARHRLTIVLDPTKASIGRDNVEMIGELLDSLAIWPFTERLGWTKAQVEALTNTARAEIKDETLKLYIPVQVACSTNGSEGG